MSRFGNRFGASSYGRKSFLPNFEITVSRVQFELIKDARLARAKFTYSTLDRIEDKRSEDIEVAIPVKAMWADPEKGEVVKAHLSLLQKDIQAIGSNVLQCLFFYRDLMKRAKKADAQNHFSLIASGQWMVRYGRPYENPYRTETESDSGYHYQYYYDSQAAALQAIIDYIRSRGLRNIGGVNTASFLKVPDGLLTQVGFQKVPDLMERSIPMWRGDAAVFQEAERDTYSTAGKQRLSEILDSFLGGLQQALQA